jgi:hypothetical protein
MFVGMKQIKFLLLGFSLVLFSCVSSANTYQTQNDNSFIVDVDDGLSCEEVIVYDYDVLITEVSDYSFEVFTLNEIRKSEAVAECLPTDKLVNIRLHYATTLLSEQFITITERVYLEKGGVLDTKLIFYTIANSSDHYNSNARDISLDGFICSFNKLVTNC